MKTLWTWFSLYRTVRNQAGNRNGEDQVRVGAGLDHAVQRLGVLGLDLSSAAIIPPVVALVQDSWPT